MYHKGKNRPINKLNHENMFRNSLTSEMGFELVYFARSVKHLELLHCCLQGPILQEQHPKRKPAFNRGKKLNKSYFLLTETLILS